MSIQLTKASSFSKFRLQSCFADIILLSNDDQRYPAHRLVLAANSDYFDRLLTGNFKVTIETKLDFSGKVVSWALDFLYGDKVNIGEVPFETILEFLLLLQYLQISGESYKVGDYDVDEIDRVVSRLLFNVLNEFSLQGKYKEVFGLWIEATRRLFPEEIPNDLLDNLAQAFRRFVTETWRSSDFQWGYSVASCISWDWEMPPSPSLVRGVLQRLEGTCLLCFLMCIKEIPDVIPTAGARDMFLSRSDWNIPFDEVAQICGQVGVETRTTIYTKVLSFIVSQWETITVAESSTTETIFPIYMVKLDSSNETLYLRSYPGAFDPTQIDQLKASNIRCNPSDTEKYHYCLVRVLEATPISIYSHVAKLEGILANP